VLDRDSFSPLLFVHICRMGNAQNTFRRIGEHWSAAPKGGPIIFYANVIWSNWVCWTAWPLTTTNKQLQQKSLEDVCDDISFCLQAIIADVGIIVPRILQILDYLFVIYFTLAYFTIPWNICCERLWVRTRRDGSSMSGSNATLVYMFVIRPAFDCRLLATPFPVCAVYY